MVPRRDLERETLHIMDDKQRIALVETKTVDSSSALTAPVSLLRYQIGNHLGSASLELDEAAQVISYEEYHPYGTTSYRATDSAIEVSPKRYRYTGKEKDEETGLYYHGARYYACWLARWGSADPSGIAAGVNLYRYVKNNPTIGIDPNGKAPLPFLLALQSDNGQVDLAELNSEPLLTPENISDFWSGGGNNLIMGAIIFTGGAIIIVGTGGAATPFVLLSSTMALGGGTIGMVGGGLELGGRAYGYIGDKPGAVLNDEQGVMFNRFVNLSMSTGSSPGGFVGGGVGALYTGDLEGAETGAAIGGLVEFGVAGAQGLKNLISKSSNNPGKIWHGFLGFRKIAVANPAKTAGMDVLSTHGGPGRITLFGLNGAPVELSAPFALSTNGERFLVAACSTACDAAAMQRLADRTNKIVGGFQHPVGFLEGTDFTSPALQ